MGLPLETTQQHQLVQNVVIKILTGEKCWDHVVYLLYQLNWLLSIFVCNSRGWLLPINHLETKAVYTLPFTLHSVHSHHWFGNMLYTAYEPQSVSTLYLSCRFLWNTAFSCVSPQIRFSPNCDKERSLCVFSHFTHTKDFSF